MGKTSGVRTGRRKRVSVRARPIPPPPRLRRRGGKGSMCNNTREREGSIDLPSLGRRRRRGKRLSGTKKEGLSFSRRHKQWHSRALLFHRFGLLWLWRCLFPVLVVEKKSVLRRRQLRRDLYLVGVAKKKRLRRFAKIFAQTLWDPERIRNKAGDIASKLLKR